MADEGEFSFPAEPSFGKTLRRMDSSNISNILYDLNIHAEWSQDVENTVSFK